MAEDVSIIGLWDLEESDDEARLRTVLLPIWEIIDLFGQHGQLIEI